MRCIVPGPRPNTSHRTSSPRATIISIQVLVGTLKRTYRSFHSINVASILRLPTFGMERPLARDIHAPIPLSRRQGHRAICKVWEAQQRILVSALPTSVVTRLDRAWPAYKKSKSPASMRTLQLRGSVTPHRLWPAQAGLHVLECW